MSLLIRVCHLSKITVMFYHVLWGQTGVSLLIRVSFVKNHSYVLSCIVGTDRGVTPHYGVSFVKNHIRKLTFVWFQLNVSPVTCSDNTTGDDYIFETVVTMLMTWHHQS